MAVFQSTSPYGTTGCCVTTRCEPGAAPPIQGSRSPCTASAAANSPSFLTERADGQDSRRRTSALATTLTRTKRRGAAQLRGGRGRGLEARRRPHSLPRGWLAARGGAHPGRRREMTRIFPLAANGGATHRIYGWWRRILEKCEWVAGNFQPLKSRVSCS